MTGIPIMPCNMAALRVTVPIWEGEEDDRYSVCLQVFDKKTDCVQSYCFPGVAVDIRLHQPWLNDDSIYGYKRRRPSSTTRIDIALTHLSKRQSLFS